MDTAAINDSHSFIKIILNSDNHSFNAVKCEKCLNYYYSTDFFKIIYKYGSWIYVTDDEGNPIEKLSCEEEIIKQLLE